MNWWNLEWMEFCLKKNNTKYTCMRKFLVFTHPMTRVLKIQIVHSQPIFSIAEVFCKKLNPNISTQNGSCCKAILSINHKCKLSYKRERNLKGISDCTTKMPVLVTKGDWKCWRMVDIQMPVQLAKILDVYTSINSFPRHTRDISALPREIHR